MSDLPELNLFEEIQGIANSADYFTYTQDEFNKTWNYYEEESAMDTKEQDSRSVWRTQTPVSNLPPTPPSSGKSSPTRDAWDPMLWHTRSLEEVELRALAELGPLSPPLSPIVMTTVSSSEVTEVYEANASKLIVTSLSAADIVPVSGCLTGSNQLVLGDQGSAAGSRRGPQGEQASGQGQAGRKSPQEESQIVSRRRGISYTPKTGSNSPTMKSQGRKKLYEMRPFADPIREKERQNAINAKKNRDKKNGLVYKAQDQIDRLKTVNKRLSKEALANRRKLSAAKTEIKRLKSALCSPSVQALRAA